VIKNTPHGIFPIRGRTRNNQDPDVLTSALCSAYHHLSRLHGAFATGLSNSYADAGRMVPHRVLRFTPSHRGSAWVCTTVAALADRESGSRSGSLDNLGLGFNAIFVTYCDTSGILRQLSLSVANVSTFLRPIP
jgi:hypothetical protein